MKEFSTKCRLMGSSFELAVVAGHQAEADAWLQSGIAEIERIERLLSEFRPDSETSRINSSAWQAPLPIDAECFALIDRCRRISTLSRGCFDISVKPLKKLYAFKNAQFAMPPLAVVKDVLRSVGYEKIILDGAQSSIRLADDRMAISFSAIGKGYASDMVKRLWMKSGVLGGYINASGDLNAFGCKADGTPWRIGIADPDNTDSVLLYVPLNNASVATSGDYEQFFMHNGVRYSHNIDPRTGLPITGIKSVTVFSPSAELSDALATAVYVMGVEEGIAFVDQLPQTHCIIVDDRNRVHFSHRLQYEEAVA